MTQKHNKPTRWQFSLRRFFFICITVTIVAGTLGPLIVRQISDSLTPDPPLSVPTVKWNPHNITKSSELLFYWEDDRKRRFPHRNGPFPVLRLSTVEFATGKPAPGDPQLKSVLERMPTGPSSWDLQTMYTTLAGQSDASL